MPSEVTTIDQALAAVLTVTREDLNLAAVDPLIVYVYENNASFARFGPAKTASIEPRLLAAGAKANELHLNMAALQGEPVKDFPLGNFLEVFAHEYGHNLHYMVAPDPPPVPKWLSEGFASWIAAKVLDSLGWQDYDISIHRFVRELSFNRQILPHLESLADPKLWNEQSVKPNGATTAYAISTLAVDRLIQREGLAAIMEYFKTGVFASSFRVSWENFAKDFEIYVSEIDVRKPVAFKMEKPEWKIGDRWLYNRRRAGQAAREQWKITNETVFEGIPCFVIKHDTEEVLYTKEALGQLANIESGELVTTRSIANAIVNWPLEKGKQWHNTYKFEDLKRKTKGMIAHLMVVSYFESVKVPAGLFDTAKIESYDSNNGRLLAEYWYSPSVKWMVKARWYVSLNGFREDELISFEQ